MNWEDLWCGDSDPWRGDNLNPYGPSSFGSDFDNLSRQDVHPEPSFLTDFGENFLGVKNMTDLSDLIAAKDKEFQVLHDAVSKTPTTSPPWPAAPDDYRAWYSDYQKLVAAWQPARAAAMAAIDTAKKGGDWTNPLMMGAVNLNTQTGEPYYGNLIKILQPGAVNASSAYDLGRYGGGTVTPGSLADLMGRLNAVQNIPAYTVPQPTKGADQELNIRNALAPFDPIGDPKAAEDWKKDLIFGGAILVGALFLASVVAKKV